MGQKLEVKRDVQFSASDGIHHPNSVTPFRNQVISWTGPVEQLLGYTAKELESTEDWWIERIHVDDREDVVQSLSRHLKRALGGPFAADARLWSSEYRFRHSDGTYVLISDNSVATRDQKGEVIGLQSILYGGHARRKAREDHMRLLESQNYLAHVANNTPSGIYMMDPQGYCIFMNKSAERITGFTSDEIYGHSLYAAMHSCHPNGDPYSITDCPIYTHQQIGTSAKNEPAVFVHKDGHHYDIEFSVFPIDDYATGGAIVEFRDITKHKTMERERLNAILVAEQQSARIAADQVHKEDMTSFVSFVCHELRSPLQGITSSVDFLNDTLQKMEDLCKGLAQTSGMIPLQENLPTKDSQIELGELSSGSSLSNRSTNNTRQMSPSAQLSIEKFNAHKLTEMENLIAYFRELVGNIRTSTDHQALITDNVLDLCKLDAGKLEPVLDLIDVQTLGDQVVEMMSARARKKHIKFSKGNSNTGPLYLKADATKLRQILLNLVSNAIKFTQEHGAIIVDMSALPSDSSGKAILHGSVTDDGPGMNAAEQQTLFQRFSQANTRVAQLYGGSGLGLSICKELSRAMGGDIDVKSEKGKGSTFSFTARLEAPTNEELENFLKQMNATPAPVPSATDSTLASESLDVANTIPKFRMIGVAEDNPINLKHLARHLSVLGYESTLCVDGKEILDKICDPNSLIDCCIMDMSMPRMDGVTCTRLIRKHEEQSGGAGTRPRIPIIALSANALKEQISGALAGGCSDYLTKPCKRTDLGRMLEYWERIMYTDAEHRPLLGG